MRVNAGVAAKTRRSLIPALVVALVVMVSSAPVMAQAAIQFRQVAYAVPQTPQSTVAVTYPAAQTAGNLNVVAIGWNDSTAAVTSVTDSRGNVYGAAVAPTVMAGKASHAIYYARNIVAAGAGANVVTVRFSVAAVYPDVRIAEYSGLDTVNPLVGGVGASGTSATSNSGALTTSVPNVLLVAANVVETTTTGPGTGFTSRMIAVPNGDILEDRLATTAGTYSGTAPLNSGYWVMQMVAFQPPSADTTPPTVTLTAPAASATVTGTVTLTATASDNVGVAGVQFKVDGVNLGAEVTGTSPYSLTWNTAGVTNGPHTLTAVARDTSGLTTTSAGVAVTVDTTPPAVTITAPVASSVVSGSVTVTATASDNIGVAGVQFKLDGVNLGAEVTGTSPYSVAWNTVGAANGPHSLTVVARDLAGLTTTSVSVPVSVDNVLDTTPPTVTITAPAASSTVTGTVTVTATASDNVGVAGVQFKLDGVNLGGEVTGASPYSVTWNTSGASNGTHTLTAVARDTSNLTTTSAGVPVTVSNDTTPPTVTITAPAAGAALTGTVTITATASDNVGVAGVQFKLDGANLGAEVTGTSPYSMTWNTAGVANGPHTLTAVARDTSNVTATSAGVPVTVDTTPPTVTLTSPAASSTVTGTLTVTATASDNTSVAGVQFKLDGANLGAEVTGTSPYSVTWNTAGLAEGPHTLSAVARDTVNLTATSADVPVIVDLTPPTVAITAPSASSTVSGTITVTATASDNLGLAGVQFKLDGANLGAEVTTPPYSVTWNTAGATNGAHSLTGVARDRANLTTSSTAVPVTVSNSAPAAIQFRQGSYAVPQTPQATVTVPFTAAQLAGSLNVVVVGWNDSTATITSVTDSRGNVYNVAAAPTVRAGAASHAMYYAPNIAAAGAGANVVTVRFSVAAMYPDVRVLEYSGLDTVSPLVGGVGASGSGATSSSGSLAVPSGSILLVAGNVVEKKTNAAGTGFTSRMITAPNGDIAEDRVVTAAGTYSGTASLASGYWVMQMAAFRQPSGPPPPDTTPPAVTITAPAASATVNGSVMITATASDNVGVAGVQFKVDGVNIGTEVTGISPYSVAWDTTGVANGPHTLTAVVRDTSNLTTTSAGVGVTVSNDTTPPTVTLTAPASGATVSGIVTVTATASDNAGVAGLQFKLDGANLGAEVTGAPPYSISWNTTGAINGSHTLAAVARDTANLTTTSAGVPVTVSNVPDTTPPTVTITAPASGATVSGAITLTATASDNVGVAGVQFKLDGANLGPEVTGTSPYSVTWSTTGATNGAHTLTAVARDTSNLTTTSSAVSVTVSNAATTPITFRQGNYAVPQSPQTAVAVTFTAAQQAGNLNVVVVGWNDSTAMITSVTDSRGNPYSVAVSPTVRTGAASHAIYFASNIGAADAGANAVTVRFNVAAAYVDVRILEYAGVDVSTPLLGGIGASGSSNLSNSGTLAITTGNVLLVAGNVVQTSTSGPGTGFTSRMITSPNGDIAEDRVVSTAGTYSATAPVGSGYWVMQMAAFRGAGAPPPPDTTPPAVAVTAPLANAVVSGAVTLAATASDDIGILGVQFKVDGANVGAEVTTPPYYVTWNAGAIPDGVHTITAVARDSVSSTTSAPISVTVSNATASDPSRIGQWSATSAWPLVGIHLTLLPNGLVLAWDGAAQQGAARLFNPATNAFTTVSPPDNIFCAGHCLLPDGRALVVGGHLQNYVGIADTNIFDPSTRLWSQMSPMTYGRWYPTATVLPDGRVLVLSGAIDCEQCIAEIPEIYNPATNTWTRLTSAPLEIPIYPHVFVQPDGRVLVTGAFEGPMATVELDLTTATWSLVDPNVVDGHNSVMYRLGKILKSGTSANSDAPFFSSQRTAYVLDMSQAQPQWRQTAPMAFPRSYHNTTLLPDGTVLVTGGNKTTDTFDETQAVLAAELWSPATETYTTMASMSVPRLYHSTALLLPDGRVLVAGGGRFGNTTGDYHDKLNSQTYSPPYLFKGPRPTITSAPTLLPYGFTFSVSSPDVSRIASVVLIALGSVTHNFNQSQRYLPLSFQQAGASLTVQGPASGNDAPPGYYMLFIVDDTGVPSVASILRIQ
jgi:Galactose oxidase-like, Early set domain/Bacterial Ig domain